MDFDSTTILLKEGLETLCGCSDYEKEFSDTE